MTSAIPMWVPRVQAQVGRLANRPASLLCLLLLANSLAQPYLGFDHDSRLYAVQISERLQPGPLAGDLFLCYGSQDRFSVFTLILAPLVSLLGLRVAFFLVYLASKLLLTWGMMRLIRVLVPDRSIAVLSLLFLAISPLSFGGNEIFHVNEAFLTPRLAASGLVLLGLEQMLAGRLWAVLPLMLGALLLHPLMAPAGILTALAWWLFRRLSVQRLVALGVLAAAVCLGYRPVGVWLFGSMDDEWRRIYLDVCYYIDPREWTAGDWGRIGSSMLVLVLAARTYALAQAPFLLAVVSTGLAGLVGSAVTMCTSYLLLYKVSPYRSLWLVEMLALPLAFWGLAILWRRGTAVALTTLPILTLLLTHDWNREGILLELCLLLAVVPSTIILFRGLGPVPRRESWPRWSGETALVVSVLVLAFFNFIMVVVLFNTPPTFEIDLHPVTLLRLAPAVLYKAPQLLVLVVLGAGLLQLLGTGRRFQLACLAGWVGYQGVLAAAGGSAWYLEHFSAGYSAQHFAVSCIRKQADALERTPTVYWPTDLRTLWLQAGARSYLNIVQLSGCGFNRGTALEGKRRARLVGPFEVAALRRATPLRDSSQEPLVRPAWARFYEAGEDTPAPQVEDLLRLCQDETLDLVIVEDAFEGLYSATDGRYYVYDCAWIRARQPGLAPAGTGPEQKSRVARSPLPLGNAAPLD